MRFKNTSEHTIMLESVGLDPVEPGAEIDIPLALCAPSRGDGGNRKPSPIECVAPQLKPVDPRDHKEWSKVPPRGEPESRIVSVNNQKPPSEPPGVKALRESLARKNAAEAKPSAPEVRLEAKK